MNKIAKTTQINQQNQMGVEERRVGAIQTQFQVDHRQVWSPTHLCIFNTQHSAWYKVGAYKPFDKLYWTKLSIQQSLNYLSSLFSVDTQFSSMFISTLILIA